MRPLYGILVLIAALPAFGHGHRTISQASDLVPWCRDEAEARYVAKNVRPAQWTASYHDSSNIRVVDATLRVHDEDVAVRCRTAAGAREEYGTIEIDDSSL